MNDILRACAVNVKRVNAVIFGGVLVMLSGCASLGLPEREPVTLEQMIYHAQCVVRGVSRSLVVVDMPFGTYQSNSDIAVASSNNLISRFNFSASNSSFARTLYVPNL